MGCLKGERWLCKVPGLPLCCLQHKSCPPVCGVCVSIPATDEGQEAVQEVDAEDSAIQTLKQDPVAQWWESLGCTRHWRATSCAVVAVGLGVFCCSLYCFCRLCAKGSAPWAGHPDLWRGRWEVPRLQSSGRVRMRKDVNPLCGQVQSGANLGNHDLAGGKATCTARSSIQECKWVITAYVRDKQYGPSCTFLLPPAF